MTSPGTRRIVGIASGVGGGKSTLARALAQEIGERDIVQFDHFERLTEQPVEVTRDWLAAGADPLRLAIPGLSAALAELAAGRPAADPRAAAPLQAQRYVVFETPFGRWHPESGRHIDFLVWIDTPLDIALARKLRQIVAGSGGDGAGLAAWLPDYLSNYLEVVERLLRLQRERVRPGADLVVDGRQDPGALARQVARALGGVAGGPPA